MSNLFNLSVPEDVPPIMRAAWIKARKVNSHEWVDEQGGARAVFHGGWGDDTWDSIHEFMEAVRSIHQEGEPWPTWVWGTQEVTFAFSAEGLLEDHFGESDDVPTQAVKELADSLERWRARWIPEAMMDSEDLGVVIWLPHNWWME